MSVHLEYLLILGVSILFWSSLALLITSTNDCIVFIDLFDYSFSIKVYAILFIKLGSTRRLKLLTHCIFSRSSYKSPLFSPETVGFGALVLARTLAFVGSWSILFSSVARIFEGGEFKSDSDPSRVVSTSSFRFKAPLSEASFSISLFSISYCSRRSKQ